MNKKLYIGNLSSNVTEDDLRANFSAAGKVLSVNIIKDRLTGLSKGFGFVEMATEDEAKEAIQKFNSGQLDEKTIIVSEARPKKEGGRARPYPSSPGGGFRGGRGRRD
ncbi:MAG: RNA-binding protein [Deltaproteobacteria bacterium]|nr:RNA-binding protein [Deltaproteobacteria bacterium]